MYKRDLVKEKFIPIKSMNYFFDVIPIFNGAKYKWQLGRVNYY
jgi:hypothetical protein